MGTERVKVLFVLANLDEGGAQKVSVTLLRHLDRDLFEPHLLVMGGAGVFESELPGDVPVTFLGEPRLRNAFWKLLRAIRRLRPDSVFVTVGYMNLGVLLLRPFLPKGIRVVVRESSIVSAALKNQGTREKIWLVLYRKLYPKADKVVCQSKFMCSDLRESVGVRGAEVVQIYNPLDTERILSLAEQGQNPVADFGAGPHILTIGRLAKDKNHGTLIKAFRHLLVQKPGAHLWLVGTGPELTVLQQLVAGLELEGRVHFKGHQVNPYLWLKYSDLFVLCSLSEGLPNALLEAIASGVPVISTVHPGGTREIFENTGQLERLVESLDWEDWWFERPEEVVKTRLEDAHGLQKVVLQYQEVLG